MNPEERQELLEMVRLYHIIIGGTDALNELSDYAAKVLLRDIKERFPEPKSTTTEDRS